ncbi:MAG: hypothetical protein JWO08_1690 [Verrucomicrobiaceae bacterium]|nr:hypothetical protein [Verrucomicrobiaceae bacterium]
MATNIITIQEDTLLNNGEPIATYAGGIVTSSRTLSNQAKGAIKAALAEHVPPLPFEAFVVEADGVTGVEKRDDDEEPDDTAPVPAVTAQIGTEKVVLKPGEPAQDPRLGTETPAWMEWRKAQKK